MTFIGQPELKLGTSYQQETLCESEVLLVVSTKYDLANKKFSLDLFRNERFITVNSNSKIQSKQDKLFKLWDLKYKPYRFDSYACIHDAASANMGFAFLPKLVVAQDIMRGILTIVPLDIELPTEKFVMVYKKELQQNSSIMAFISHAKRHIT